MHMTPTSTANVQWSAIGVLGLRALFTGRVFARRSSTAVLAVPAFVAPSRATDRLAPAAVSVTDLGD